MSDALPIYLQLAPEQGGIRFGPFKQRFDIGSDTRRVQLVLDARHGIFPIHAIGAQMQPGLLTLQPAAPGCNLFVTPAGQSHAWPVTAPVQVKHGDQLTFGTPEGPRFMVYVDQAAAQGADQILKAAGQKGGEAGALHAISGFMDRIFGPPESSGIAGEVQRRSQAELLRRSPYREIYGIWTRLKTGVLTSPRTVVALVIAFFGLVSTGGLTCSGLVLAFYRAVMY